MRRGVTLVELLVVLALSGLAGAAGTAVLVRQQRFYAAAAGAVEQRVHLRDATTILPVELRALAPGAGDLVAYTDTSVDLRATIGVAVACDTVPGGSALHLVPERGGVPYARSAFATAPEPGDVALVYDEGAADSDADDGWAERAIAEVARSASACADSPLAPEGDVAPLRLTLAEGLPSTVRPGAFVRVVRRVRYRFYRAATGDWYLGYSEWDGTGFDATQPVSGPFAPYSRDGASGLSLRYFDDADTEVAGDPGRVRRIRVVTRGALRGALGGPSATLRDSVVTSVTVRNP